MIKKLINQTVVIYEGAPEAVDAENRESCLGLRLVEHVRPGHLLVAHAAAAVQIRHQVVHLQPSPDVRHLPPCVHLRIGG